MPAPDATPSVSAEPEATPSKPLTADEIAAENAAAADVGTVEDPAKEPVEAKTEPAPEPTKPEKPRSFREDRFEEIEANRLKDRDRERDAIPMANDDPYRDPRMDEAAPEPAPEAQPEVHPEAQPAPEPEPQQSVAPTTAPDPAAEPAPAVPTTAPDPGGTLDPETPINMIIDGQHHQAPLRQVISTAQKAGAVDARLQEATRQLEESTRLLSAARDQTTIAPDPQETPAAEPAAGELDISKIAESLQTGTQEEAEAAVRQIFGGVSPQSGATPDQIADAATNRAVLTIENRSAANTIRGEFPGVLSDPILAGIASQRFNQISNDEANLNGGRIMTTHLERTRDAAKWTQDHYGKTTDPQTNPVPPQPQPTPAAQPGAAIIDGRLAAKQGLDVPKPANAAAPRMELPSEQKPSDAISEMRKGRGQPN